MPKIYKDINVYDAAIIRYQTVFNEFDNYYVSVSGGKDSSIMLQLMAQEARRARKKRFPKQKNVRKRSFLHVFGRICSSRFFSQR